MTERPSPSCLHASCIGFMLDFSDFKYDKIPALGKNLPAKVKLAVMLRGGNYDRVEYAELNDRRSRTSCSLQR
ncbi:hypothetical protein J7T55_015452 [Diaporthe amygdali]|uniref:uncharacterized protein n=1 Tax=Phomopsis amygdali TaxID=1214568 RepID=UPI0022FE7546|nr:uncharacterized protein J7T55_015452 [Diaporthe amygdali]KAJ0120720.1 hypothetical protein J7T55_015452 [Diaporthe amygdali]